MTRVDFYVLSDDTEAQRVEMACRLAEKAIRESKKVFIHTDDEHLAKSVDSALWHFRDDAFVPHRTVAEQADNRSTAPLSDAFAPPQDAEQSGTTDIESEPVEIGFGCQPAHHHTVLINLSNQVPPFFSRFERTLEIVNQHQEVRSSGRDRYSFYQQRGYPLQHHKL